MKLQCAMGHEWERPPQRGRPPKYCPKHSVIKRAMIPERKATPAKPGIVAPPDEQLEILPAVNDGEYVTEGVEAPGNMGTKLRIPASDVRPGDWTMFSGYRPVLKVKRSVPGWYYRANGSKVYGPRVAFHRTGAVLAGEKLTPRIDRIVVTEKIVVYRKEA